MIHMGKFNRWFGSAFDLDFQMPSLDDSFFFASLKLEIIKYRELLYEEFMVEKI